MAIPAKNVALGLRAHSGWAMLVAVAGPLRAPVVIHRQRVELVDPRVRGAKQPYHAARELELRQAEGFLRERAGEARRLARRALRAVVEDLRRKGLKVVGCGILLGPGRSSTPLAQTLASHPMVHAAEGEFFRNAIIHGSKRAKLPVVGVRERELFARGAAKLRLSADALRCSVTEMGRPLGRPWRQDEKYATLLAWLTLAVGSRQ